MQWRADGMAVRPSADRSRDGDASGMPDPEMCVSCGDRPDRAGVLDDEKVERGKRFVK